MDETPEEKAAAEKKAAEDKAAEDKAAEEKEAADKKKADETAAEEEGAEAPSPLEESKKLVEEMKKQNKEWAANLKKAEKIAAEMMLGGRAPAGKEETQDEKEVAEAKKLLAGTGFDELLFPTEKKDG